MVSGAGLKTFAFRHGIWYSDIWKNLFLREEDGMDRNQLMTFIGQIVRIAKDQTQAALLLSQLEELLAKDDQKERRGLHQRA